MGEWDAMRQRRAESQGFLAAGLDSIACPGKNRGA